MLLKSFHINSSFTVQTRHGKYLANVKTRGEKRQAKPHKQKAGGNDVLPANDADRPTGDNTGGSIMSIAALAGKLDIIMVRLNKLDVLDQLAAQVASLSTSLEFCHASIAELRTENESLRTQVTTITRDTDERRRQAASDHDAVVDLQWRSMRDNLVFYGIREETDENCNTVLAQFFTDELGVTDEIDLARAHRMGKATTGKTRPIVAKFERLQQREKVRMAGPRLAGKKFGVSEQIPKEWQEKRKSLLLHFKDAKKQGKRARFVGPKLLVEGHFVTLGVPSHQA